MVSKMDILEEVCLEQESNIERWIDYKKKEAQMDVIKLGSKSYIGDEEWDC